jgi:uncharacterized Zn-binding protein involved in type VI secretion
VLDGHAASAGGAGRRADGDTAAKLGVFSPAPCVPATTAPWTPGATKVMVDGQPALHSGCTAMCMWGGVISISDPGNKGIVQVN